jgi:hypothetical protein
MATRESPRAIVLVKAVIRTLTAFSHGELPCAAKAGAASKSARIVRRGDRREKIAKHFARTRFMEVLPCSVKFQNEGSPRRNWAQTKTPGDDCEGRLFAP